MISTKQSISTKKITITKGTKMLKRTALILISIMAANSLFGEPEFERKKVNYLYLKKMPSKLWWNKDFKYRMPILISETIGKKREKAIVDFICDFGRKVNPDSVRVVTPWEEEVSSQVTFVSDNKTEIIFKTSLRKYQNKPFFIYFGNPNSQKPDYDTDLSMKWKKGEINIRNEKIQVVFSANHKRSAKIKKFRISGSSVENQLTERNTGVTWAGFDLGKIEVSEKPEVKLDGLFKKTLEYKAKDFSLEYSIYSFSPRIDYKIIPHGARYLKTVTKWVAGGGDAYDTFYYEGLKGPMHFKAGPDKSSDKGDVYPNKKLTKWMREGWAALQDRKRDETVGSFWNLKAMKNFRYYSQYINGGETFFIDFSPKEPVTGALIAIKGNWKAFRNDYIDWKNPPVVNQGKTQEFNLNIQPKRPNFVKDFTRDFKFSTVRDGQRITDDFAVHMVKNIRKLSGNAAKLNIYHAESIPLTKELYERYKKVYKKYYKSIWKPKKFPEYKASMATDTYLQGLIKAAHEKGLAVRTWNIFCPIRHYKKSYINDPVAKAVLLDIYKAIAASGIDLLQTSCSNEWAKPPAECGSVKGPFWDKADVWFERNNEYVEFAKHVHKEIKKDYPNLPINTLCSVDGWLPKLQFMDEKAPYLDTVENEFCPGMIPNMHSLKYGIKRMHGIFGNDGRTIQHHFYYYTPNPLYRVSEMELPMIFGVKSFSHEDIKLSINNPELNEITADFYRLTDYTALDKFVAGCAPYKFIAIIRDGHEVKNDIRAKRLALFPGKYSLHEARCKQLMTLKNIPMDLVFNRFFKKDEFNKYKLVFVPSDRSLKNEYVKELAEYVKEGGCVIAEGSVVDNKLFAELAGVKKIGDVKHKADIDSISMTAPVSVEGQSAKELLNDSAGKPAIFINKVGKGKVVYSPYILTDDLNNSKEKELFIRKLICDLVGNGPIVPSENLVAQIDSSLLANGANEYFFGVYNPASETRLNTEIALDIPRNKKLFVLNMKTGERAAFNGKVKVDIAPLQTGFYVIGTDQTTALPEFKAAPNAGGSCNNPGMKFLGKKTGEFKFEFSKPGKAKVVGVLNIHDKRGRQSQAWGAKAIYDCFVKNIKDAKIIYLENLQNKTINGCDAVIVPNMGTGMPYQLHADWWKRVADFAKQGGGAMLIHHAIGIGEVGEPAFPSIGKWSGMYYPVHDFKVVKEHPVTKGLKIGDIFHDNCWDYDQIAPGENGIVLARGLRKDGIPTAALVVGKYGKGNVVVSGIGIGSGGKRENGKYVKYEAEPQEGLEKILLNSVNWMLKK
jgi:hypothetical protein